MKIATVGKGGSGKTTLAGTLARIMARDSGTLLAIDGDHNPNLALTLGIRRQDSDQINYIPPTLMKRTPNPDGPDFLSLTMSEDDVMRTYAATAPDGVKLIVMGRPLHGSAGSG
ncbi:MAG: AAA family ATPase [Rhodospirillaceae bacterium]|jgi:CO dehydrogenase maturation factor|nr:AAA family ATPase [Rhodospirillaceae bacterium]MBT7768797.1 AAA family ATPase [Rhodospirillales bacterium]MBT4699690.1 AAA family ATPase [Rhodospirillaceae bacterium]MBT5034445.1 AAA family ATPase [Rhodospirillaceae bacterium]MBT6218411.1 AAA family ATPase [Rhodospirillaceae bacterium]